MSNEYNDILRESLMEKAEEIVNQMLEDKELNPELKEETIMEIYQSLWEERDFSIEAQMDDDSGDESLDQL